MYPELKSQARVAMIASLIVSSMIDVLFKHSRFDEFYLGYFSTYSISSLTFSLFNSLVLAFCAVFLILFIAFLVAYAIRNDHSKKLNNWVQLLVSGYAVAGLVSAISLLYLSGFITNLLSNYVGISFSFGQILNKSFNPKLIDNMNDEEAINYLSSLRQIGRWSAEMILLFTYNRSNIWPIQDIGLLRAISKNYKKKYLPSDKFVNLLKKKFSPYCSVATWYLWRSIDPEPIQY